MSDPDQLQKTTKFDFFRVSNFGVVRFYPWLRFTFIFLIELTKSSADATGGFRVRIMVFMSFVMRCQMTYPELNLISTLFLSNLCIQ